MSVFLCKGCQYVVDRGSAARRFRPGHETTTNSAGDFHCEPGDGTHFTAIQYHFHCGLNTIIMSPLNCTVRTRITREVHWVAADITHQ